MDVTIEICEPTQLSLVNTDALGNAVQLPDFFYFVGEPALTITLTDMKQTITPQICSKSLN